LPFPFFVLHIILLKGKGQRSTCHIQIMFQGGTVARGTI